MNIVKKVYLISILIIVSFTFTSCNSSSQDEATLASLPVVRDFIANVDTNETNKVLSLGYVDVITEGSSNINSFRLEGSGYSNFTITREGEIRTNADGSTVLDCSTFDTYNLDVIATNSFGDSDKAGVTIQVNCMDEPVLKAMVLSIDDYTTGNIGTMDFVRTGIINTSTGLDNNDPYNDIKEIEVISTSPNISITNSGSISLSDPMYDSESRYDIKVRAINNHDKIGPYVSLTIYVNYTGTYSNSGDSTTNTTYDDYPDSIGEVYFTSTYIYSGTGSIGINGNINYAYDNDYIRINISQEKELSFSLVSNGSYSFGISGDNISLYDANYNYMGGGSYAVTTTWSAGDYYIKVSEASDFYTLNINYTDTNTEINDDYPDVIEDVGYTSINIYSGTDMVYFTGVMDYAYDYDYIEIYLYQDKVISLDLLTNFYYSFGLNNDNISLYDENYSYLGSYSSTYPATTLSAGNYYIRISETSDNYTVNINYSDVNVSTVDTIGNDTATSSSLALNSSYSSSIDYSGDRDVYRFDLTSDSNVSIYTSSDIDTYGRLYDANGTEIASDDDSAGTGGDFKINIQLTPNIYYIDVAGLSDSTIGAYELFLEAQ